MGLDEIKHALKDPDGLKAVYKGLKLFRNVDDTYDFINKLSEGEIDEAIEATEYSREEFYDTMGEIREYSENLAERYEITSLEWEEEFEDASELMEELGIDEEEYMEMVHGAALRSAEDVDDFRYK